ncbi:MAG: primosomal protein N' [Vicinamibacterales bacterium]
MGRGYYLAGPGAALSVALPPHGLTGRVDAFKTVRVATLTAQGSRSTRASMARRRLARRPLRCHGWERASAGPVAAGRTAGRHAHPRARRGRRVGGNPHAPQGDGPGLVADRARGARPVRGRSPRVQHDDTRGLAPAHRRTAGRPRPAVAHGRGEAFRTALLHGVTGSGKTEIYLRLAERVRASGRGVLVLVPEIALTPQVAALFRARFGRHVAIQHSGLSDGERHDQWHRIRRGEVDVVVGTRSAVFAPLARPGLIVVDEEHDTSYKQEDTPRYHGRDVAVMRGKLAGALVVLGSATPSLESFANARAGRYALATLERRVLDRALADVRIVNMREEMAEDRGRAQPPARGGAGRAARGGERAVILLNRRGYATAMFCRQCGHTLECPNCSVSLTVHARGRTSASDPQARRARRPLPLL